MKKYLYVLVLLLLLFSFFSCSSDETIIYGQFFTNPGKSLKGYRIQLGLIGEDQSRYNYYTNLSRDGKFRFRVKEKGNFIAFIGLNQFPSSKPIRPFVSTDDGRLYKINTVDNRRILIDRYLFITKPLKVFSPSAGEDIFLDSNQVIEWEKDIFADFYVITFIRRSEEDRRELAYFSAHIKENSIAIKDFFNLPLSEEVIDYDIIPFAWTTGEITSGEYSLVIRGLKVTSVGENLLASSGHRVVRGERRTFFTSESEHVNVRLLTK